MSVASCVAGAHSQNKHVCFFLQNRQPAKPLLYVFCPHRNICIPDFAAELLQHIYIPHLHVAGDALLPVQSAASQLNSAQKPELDSFTLRRRQSFNFADSRVGQLLPKEAGLTRRGQPSENPHHHSSSTAASVPSVAPRQEAATAGPPRKAAIAQLPAPVPGLQPGVAAKLAQPAQKQKLNTAVVQKTGTSADGKPKPASKGQIAPPAKSFGGQSGQRTPIGGEATRAQRQDSSLAQLVEKYKTDSAARKQGHNEITLERINSLAAGLQHAASGKLGDTRPTAPSSVQKQVADATAAFASSSRMLPATQDKLAAGAKPEAAKTADVARPLQVNKSKSMKATAKGKAPMKHIAGASGAMVQKNNKSAHSSTSSDSD